MRRMFVMAAFVFALGSALSLFVTVDDARGQGDEASAISGANSDQRDIEWIIADAEAGNARSQFNLGGSYQHGDGVPKDEFLALYWYRRSAENGFYLAQGYLGVLYEEGSRGLPQDMQKAIYWYKRAARSGETVSAYYLGVFNRDGALGPRDIAAAYWWFRTAAQAGFHEAQFALGQMYETGEGVRADIAQAVDWYKKAAEQGNEAAQDAVERLSQ